MNVWPAGVPWRPALPFDLVGPANAVVVTQFDKGPEQRRRGTSANLSTVDVTLALMTVNEADALNHWHDRVLGAGTMSFEAVNPLTGLIRVWTFRSPITVRPINATICRVTFTLALYPDLT